MKEAKNVQRSAAFEYVTVEGSEKLFNSRPVAPYSSSNVMMKLSYDISVWLQPAAAAMEGVWHSCTKEGIFCAVTLEYPYFHFSNPLVNRVEQLKGITNM
jgi:hypothetical protein